MKENYNLSYLKELSDGDKNFENKLLDILKAEFPLEIKEYNTNIKLGFFTIASENVHKLKHKISILGLEKSYIIAAKYEIELKSNNLGLQHEFEEILNNMIEILKKI
jgi:HPt (histidine-containing phosphotransfer) domain-containing protein